MPARTDHDLRRRHVATIAADLIAEGGLAAATNRGIAAAAGCSTTLVSHYFSDKRDLVLATYRQVGDRVTSRLQAAAESRSRRLPRTLEALLPLDEDRQKDWRLLFTFLGLAATDDELALEQRARLDAARQHIRRVLDEENLGGANSAVTAAALLATVLGLGMQATFDPEAWPPQRLRRTLDAELRRRTARVVS